MKRAMLACAAILCMCCLCMVACSGNSSSASSAPASSNSSPSESLSSSSPGNQFIGQWELAGAEIQGIIAVGEINKIVDTETVSVTSIEEDGTAQASVRGIETPATWSVKNGEITIVVNTGVSSNASSSGSATASSASRSSSGEASSNSSSSASETNATRASKASETFTLKGIVENGIMKLASSADTSYTMLFTHDGTLPYAPAIDLENAQPITEESELIGTWNLSGLKMMGISMYGKVEDISSVSGVDIASLSFDKNGKVTFGANEATFTVGPEGAALVQAETISPVMSIDNRLALDISKAVGMDLVLLFTEQPATLM